MPIENEFTCVVNVTRVEFDLKSGVATITAEIHPLKKWTQRPFEFVASFRDLDKLPELDQLRNFLETFMARQAKVIARG